MGEVPWTFVNKGTDAAIEKIHQLKEIYKDNFYLELNRTGLRQWEEINLFIASRQRPWD